MVSKARAPFSINMVDYLLYLMTKDMNICSTTSFWNRTHALAFLSKTYSTPLTPTKLTLTHRYNTFKQWGIQTILVSKILDKNSTMESTQNVASCFTIVLTYLPILISLATVSSSVSETLKRNFNGWKLAGYYLASPLLFAMTSPTNCPCSCVYHIASSFRLL